ncbi:hypothetical protein RN001_011676 [Aquatica leii]|uniref:Uncharacterized protein n=1 Tax=Aquatica leii TaxID=1421715 RepID=A0AAN7PS29_9COLE|nr:hypothetical protein RN001_011676 [Aquatica leii]
MNSELDNLKPTTNNSSRWSTLPINIRAQAEHILQNAVLMTEMGIDLKEKSLAGQKYISCLRSLAIRASKTMNTLHSSSIAFLILAQKLVQSVMTSIDAIPTPDQSCTNIKVDFEKLLVIIEKEISDVEENEGVDAATSTTTTCGLVNMSLVTDKIKSLEAKRKLSDNFLLPPSSSTKSVKSDIDEKYPENLSRESLIDLNNVVNLPTVPEDIFTCFSSKPTRTSSLSSLKSIRKVKLFLQRASTASDDEDESSEPEEHDFNKLAGDCDEGKPPNTSYSSGKKVFLGNIKEETQQD